MVQVNISKISLVIRLENILRNTAKFALSVVEGYVLPGDTVIDATCGNGHDTLSLAQMVGEEGKVYGFDVSGVAIQATMRRLQENDVQAEIELIYNGHEEMDLHIQEPVKAIVFNLGYLPGEDKNNTTKAATTLTALKKAVNMIQTDGIVSVVLYPGHAEGRKERDAVLSWAEKLDKSICHAAYVNMINQPDTAPEIVFITRKK